MVYLVFLKLFFFREGAPKIIVYVSRNLCLQKRNKEAVVRARRLIQYFQLPDKKILAILRGTFITFRGISSYLRIYSTVSL
jgi:hypothetical protein